MGEELDNEDNSLEESKDSLSKGRDSENNKFGEVYEDLNDFKETKHKIEELIRFKQSLIDLEETDFKANSVKFKEFKSQAIDAINHLFDECEPNDQKEKNSSS